MTEHDLRREILEKARQLLTLLYGESPDEIDVSIRRGADIWLRERVIPEERLRGLSDLQHRILNVLTRTPQPAKVLAKKAGGKYGSHFRVALGELVDRDLVRHVTQGYRLPPG